MSRFFVGQRVRIVSVHPWSNWDYLIGCEGVVNELGCSDTLREGILIGVSLLGEDDWAFHPDDLEPILDQHQPCESEFKESLDKLLEGMPA